MKRGTLNIIISLIFLLAVGAGYYFIWSGARSASQGTTVSATVSYTPVDVSGIKAQAEKLVQSRQNNAGIPIPAPTGKLGKTDPFSEPQ